MSQGGFEEKEVAVSAVALSDCISRLSLVRHRLSEDLSSLLPLETAYDRTEWMKATLGVVERILRDAREESEVPF